MLVRCRKDYSNNNWKVKISFIINHDSKIIYDFLKMSYIDDNNNNNIDNMHNIGWDKKIN